MVVAEVALSPNEWSAWLAMRNIEQSRRRCSHI